MDCEPEIMQELLSQIDLLQEEMREINSKSALLSNELEILKSEKIKYSHSNIDYKNLESLKDIDSDIIPDKLVEKVINNSLFETIISFSPYEDTKKVNIIGDFTNWESKEMFKVDGENRFKFPIKLLKGYRYFYVFEADSNKTCDFNGSVVENPKTKDLCNELIVPNATSECLASDVSTNIDKMEIESSALDENNNIINLNKKEIIDFNEDFETNKLNLQSSIKSEYAFKPLIPEIDIIDRLAKFSSNFHKREEEIKKRRLNATNQIKEYYSNSIKEINDYSKSKLDCFINEFTERVLKVDSYLYLIKSIDFKNNCFKGIKLYDKNLIKINMEYHNRTRLYDTINFHSVLSKGKLFSIEESNNIMEDYNNSQEILKIYYQTILISGEPNYSEMMEEDEDDNMGFSITNSLRNRFSNNSNNAEREIVPYKILPEGIDINQYNLIIEKDTIIEIKTRDTGSVIKFEAIHINNNTSTRKFSGFVSTSMLKVYTTLYSKDIINIIHVHLNDTSEEIAVDSVFMEPNENPEDHKEFKKDSFGKKLNYKFLFKEYKLNKIYYNLSDNFIDEPKFEEIRISPGNIIRINHETSDKKLINFKDFYAKITNINLGMLARKDVEKKDVIERLKSSDTIKEGYCVERHLEELPGFIDVQVMFNNKKEKLQSTSQMKFSVPICNVTLLSIKEQVEFEKEIIKAEMNLENKLKDEIFEVYDKVKSWEDLIKFDLLSTKITDIEEAKYILEYISSLSLEKFKSLENSHNDEVGPMLNFIRSIQDSLMFNLQKHIRVLSFSKK